MRPNSVSVSATRGASRGCVVNCLIAAYSLLLVAAVECDLIENEVLWIIAASHLVLIAPVLGVVGFRREILKYYRIGLFAISAVVLFAGTSFFMERRFVSDACRTVALGARLGRDWRSKLLCRNRIGCGFCVSLDRRVRWIPGDSRRAWELDGACRVVRDYPFSRERCVEGSGRWIEPIDGK